MELEAVERLLSSGSNGAMVVFAWVLLRHELRIMALELKKKAVNDGD